MTMRLSLGLMLMMALPVAAQTEPGSPPAALDAETFDRLTRGRIMGHYDGPWYGAEEYFSGRRVIWQDADGCMAGTWEQRGDQICFIYEDGLPDRCWVYLAEPDGTLSAWFEGDMTGNPIMLREQQDPIRCPELAPLS